MRRRHRTAITLLMVGLAGCNGNAPSADAPTADAPPSTPGESTAAANRHLPGGDTTTIDLDPMTHRAANAFSQPAANLSPAARGQFAVGNSFFTHPWVSAPASTAARDGLGPLFNAAACQECHIHDGRGHAPPDAGGDIVAAVVRIAGEQGDPHPIYGGQIQPHALPGIPAEARTRVSWQSQTITLPDGSTVDLRTPRITLSDWGYGAPDAPLATSLRIAPPMIGLGLLQAIPAADIHALAAKQARDHPDTAGAVRTLADTTAIGRFGWKASQPTVRAQSLDALANDLGITSALHPTDACTPTQTACRQAINGGQPELTDTIDAAITFYASHLAPPARRDIDRPDIRAGEQLFGALGCATCHQPSWRTGDATDTPALANQTIWPYTDLLLHDMGPGLADGVAEGNATGAQWRTPPLWGLGHTKTVSGAQAGYLHDGRARTLVEAIVWHGGQAQSARDAWMALPAPDRRKLIRFLASL